MTSCSRRSALRVLSASIFAPIVVVKLLNRAAAAQSNPERTPEQWMSEWMAAGKPVAGGLYLGRFKDPMYFLLQPITRTPTRTQNLPSVTAPKGFVTDLASIPRVFWSLLRPDGEYAYAAVIHDYLYWTQTTSREVADDVFKATMEELNVDGTTVLAIYTAVRGFGQSAWDQNAADRKNGGHRILRRFPEDPRVTWAQWKSDPDVFVSGPF
jgi:Protein of unknown function (DUF1353)